VYRTVVPRNVKLAEAPSFGKPALVHDPDSRGALAYLALAGEMLRREEGGYASGNSRAASALGDLAAAPSMDPAR
jgi:chromosome partitioning protein